MRCFPLPLKIETQPETLELFVETKFISREELSSFAEAIRAKGLTIATLNGSFDLMHAGHLQIIFEAKQQADVLIVALNSDESIKAYKSKDRPIVPLHYRLKMMAALQFVDYVTSFEETDPIRLLQEIKPNVHVNGSEYGINCIESEAVKQMGGVIHIVDLVASLSTSQLIKKIKELP